MARFSRLSVLLSALVLLLVSAPVVAQRSGQQAGAATGLQALVAGEDGLRFSLHVPAYSVDTAGVLSAGGLDSRMSEPGAPALPYFSALIALPPEATATMTVETRSGASSSLPRPLSAAPRPAGDLPGVDLEEMPRQLAGLTSPDPALYARDALFPASVYRLSEPMYYRDLRVVRLDLFPLRANPARGLLEYRQQLDVSVSFHGASFANLQPAPTAGDRFASALAGALLNNEQAAAWRSLPQNVAIPSAGLPVGRDSYRIAVQEDGIYEITGQQLQAAGMDIASVSPNTLEIMYRGEPVAYEFVGIVDDGFQPGEKIRFYGWAFDGPRSEDQYVTENVFWLWAGGTPTRIDPLTTSAPGPQPASFRAEVSREPKSQYTGTRLDEADWASSPNEPDAWYWEWLNHANVTPATVYEVTRTIDLPHPAASGDATLTVELMSYDTVSPYGDVKVSMGPGMTHQITTTWLSPGNNNIELTLPATALQDGQNQVRLTFYNHRANRITYFLNRFTVSYPRLFVAAGDQLIFRGTSGSQTYQVNNFTAGATPLVWEIGNRLQPRAVSGVQVSPDGSGSRFTFNSAADQVAFIATTVQAVKTPASISRYDAPSLDPVGGADWLAITYPAFEGRVQELAAHRADSRFGGLRTAVVSIKDVINQYGYGLPLPGAIRDYLTHALYTWEPAPQYVLLAGDATVNPHHATCDGPNDAYTICNYWADDQQITYVPTHLPFKDRFNGQIPSDYPNVLLAGSDLLPDMAIGRLAVQSAQEVQNIVAKIVDYETGLRSPGPIQRRLVFLADNTDSGGNFCADNAAISSQIPDSYTTTQICQANDTDAAVLAARGALSAAVNYPNGATILSYRGHGSVFNWGDNLVSINEPFGWLWANNKPLVILSMDCLDGNFIFPAQPALSETFVALDGAGSVAHWSSTGLGFTFEHFKLHSEFFKGVFTAGLKPIGDVTNYAKVQYAAGGFDESELWSFTLQGDPAMILYRDALFLPMLTER